MAKHTDQQFEQELHDLNGRLLMMAGLVEKMISDSIDALLQRDTQLAERTIALDRHVNRAEVDIDQTCMSILARRQPVAGDLRLVTLAMKMVTDIERIGDVVVNICERVLELNLLPDLGEPDVLAEMSRRVRRMLQDAIDAFVHRDPEKAQQVLDSDDAVDEMYHAEFRRLVEKMRQSTASVDACIALQSVAKFLERIGDHCTNLAEQVIFLVRGEDRRHQGKLA